MEDTTLRSLRVLGRVEVVLCEDTRRFGRLFKHHEALIPGQRPKLLSYTDYNRDQRIPEAINLLLEDKDIALVSDSGIPLLSDPGYKLVREILRLRSEGLDIGVEALPGANAVLPALQLSGFPPDRFYFAGFVPRKEKARKEFFKQLPPTTVILFESPYRLLGSLDDLAETRGDPLVAVCREITKIHQEVLRGSAQGVRDQLEEKKAGVKGEIVLVVDFNE